MHEKIKIKCFAAEDCTRKNVKVRLIKAPLVDSKILKSIIHERAKALVL